MTFRGRFFCVTFLVWCRLRRFAPPLVRVSGLRAVEYFGVAFLCYISGSDVCVTGSGLRSTAALRAAGGVTSGVVIFVEYFVIVIFVEYIWSDFCGTFSGLIFV